MVGLTTWQAFFLRTMLSLHEKRVLVVGYGTVGQGLAFSARAFGGVVMVAERDPARLLQARYDGWETGSVDELAGKADLVCTATGAANAVPWRVIQGLRDGCFLLIRATAPTKSKPRRCSPVERRADSVREFPRARFGGQSVSVRAAAPWRT